MRTDEKLAAFRKWIGQLDPWNLSTEKIEEGVRVLGLGSVADVYALRDALSPPPLGFEPRIAGGAVALRIHRAESVEEPLAIEVRKKNAPLVRASLARGVIVLSIDRADRGAIDALELKAAVLEAYALASRQRSRLLGAKSCIIDLGGGIESDGRGGSGRTLGGEAMNRALYALFQRVTEGGGSLFCAGYPEAFAGSLESLGLPSLEGFELVAAREEALERVAVLEPDSLAGHERRLGLVDVSGRIENGDVVLTVRYASEFLGALHAGERLRREIAERYEALRFAGCTEKDQAAPRRVRLVLEVPRVNEDVDFMLHRLWRRVVKDGGELVCIDYPAGAFDRRARQGFNDLPGLRFTSSEGIEPLEPLSVTVRSPQPGASGDFHGRFDRKDGSFALWMGDVEGHGERAARTASAVSAILEEHREAWADKPTPLKALEAAEGLLLKHWAGVETDGHPVCVALIDPRASVVSFASAAMPPALLFRAGWGAPTEIFARGMYLGAGFYVRLPHTEQWERYQPGDVLLLMSDGILEATDAAGRLFGRMGVANAVALVGLESPQRIADAVFALLRRHTGRTEPQDDQTLLVLKL